MELIQNMLIIKYSFRETHLYNEKRDLKIAERKFFKTMKQPNLLTWEEKEQIRYLHNYDSEEWTVSNLSESFPASVEIIKVKQFFILIYIPNCSVKEVTLIV